VLKTQICVIRPQCVKVLEIQRESINKCCSSEIHFIGKYDGCVTARIIDAFRLLRNDRMFFWQLLLPGIAFVTIINAIWRQNDRN